MAFQLSPGVNVSEIDLTTVVPAVATSDGAIGGVFRWGPIGQRVLVDSESILVSRFGKPTNFNAETFFTAANFLSYTNRLWVSRAANTTGATPTNSFVLQANTTVSNNVLVGNTSGISANMYITQTGNSSVVPAGNSYYVTSVNSTAIVLSKNLYTTAVGATSAVTANATLYFGHPETAYTAAAVQSGGFVANLTNQIVKNENDYTTKDGGFDSDIAYLAKYPGQIGNSLRVSVCDNSNSFSQTVNVSSINTALTVLFDIGSNNTNISWVGSSNTESTDFYGAISTGDQILTGNSTIGYQYMQVVSKNLTSNATTSIVNLTFEDPYRLHTAYTTNRVTRYWEFYNVVDSAPGQSTYQAMNGNTSALDEVHVVVVDNGGAFTGTPGTVLEVYKGLSRATDAKNNDNTGNYYKDVINKGSQYIWWANDRSGASSNNALNLTSTTSTAPLNITFTLGADGSDETSASLGVLGSAYDLFVSAEDVDVSLVLQGRPTGGATNSQLANYIIDNICEIRKDCVALISPDKSNVVNNIGYEATSLKTWRNTLRSTSYAVLDSGYKYQYDRYNDVYRWIPLNGDIGGLCARTDQTNDAWWSPAGFNRGNIKNLVKLAYNPRKSERDVLYSNGINPVVTFPGQGTVLYGDKTLLAKPSAFDRINVRRLFIVLEKAISTAAKYSLFEFNDAFTRSQFKNLVTPYLRTIKGRRGITDFLVVCDENNNTPQIIDTNQFVGDIYIKPARSINFIQLNFVAVATGVQFSEVVGKF
jgi:hypothetical protein